MSQQPAYVSTALGEIPLQRHVHQHLSTPCPRCGDAGFVLTLEKLELWVICSACNIRWQPATADANVRTYLAGFTSVDAKTGKEVSQ